MFKLGPISSRTLILGCIFTLGLAGVAYYNFKLDQAVIEEAVLPNFARAVDEGNRKVLQSLVEAETIALEQSIAGLTSREEQVAAVVAQTDPIRFFEDNSGYFFTYDFSGTRINVPPNKSGNGQNYIDMRDVKDNLLVQDLIAAAKKGGGFVTYWFEKPGKGVQPKLSYVKPIGDTGMLVGAGVYIDNVEAEQTALETQLAAKHDALMTHKYVAFGATLLVVLVAAFLIARSISSAVKKPLLKTIETLNSTASEMTLASDQVTQSAAQLAEGASEQAASVEQTSASLEELSTTMRGNLDRAREVGELSAAAAAASTRGNGTILRMNEVMDAIGDSSNQIRSIIKLIEEIAFQTNLLALNAAVEAARAGEQGKGFAVVASEVRNLAGRAAEAARDTAQLIDTSAGHVQSGIDVAHEATEALSSILAGVSQVSEIIETLVKVNEEQTIGVEQLNLAMSQISEVTQSNAASAEESAASAQMLSQHSETTHHMVASLAKLTGGNTTTA